jgi:phosphoserine phosphatase RsbU/P
MSQDKTKFLSATNFEQYLQLITHDWLRTLATLGFTLIPVFFLLDFFMLPRENLTRFAVYRVVVTGIVMLQWVVIRLTPASRYSIFHGYVFSSIVTLMIALMTVDLGGFSSSYYAGINLVIIATMLLIPWTLFHSIINVTLIISIYVSVNLIFPKPVPVQMLVNNLYFMISTGVISVSINFVQFRLTQREFETRQELRAATEALRGEMEIAKMIQTRLLPKSLEIPGYEIYARMMTATEVGGDYYDVVPTSHGNYLAIGDVAGHGVDSGLIMMMTQTSVASLLTHRPSASISSVIEEVNDILTENIRKLDVDRYMSLLIIKIDNERMSFAGKHQDIKVFRSSTGKVLSIPTQGAWIGVLKDIHGLLTDTVIDLEPDDVILLFTDGVTEAMNCAGDLYGEDRLDRIFAASACLAPGKIVEKIFEDLQDFQEKQRDDITLFVCKKNPAGG